MVEMNRDAMRHLKDAHKVWERNHGDDLKPMQAEGHQLLQEDQEEQEKQQTAAPAQQPGHEIDDLRRDFYQSLRDLRRDPREEAREEKKDRTEQTEYQRQKAARDAMREQFNYGMREGPASSNEEEGQARERERD